MFFASHAIIQLKQRDEPKKNLRAWRHCFNRFYERQLHIPFDSKVRLKSEVHSWAKTSCPPSKPVSRADTMLLRQMSALACTVFTLEKETGIIRWQILAHPLSVLGLSNDTLLTVSENKWDVPLLISACSIYKILFHFKSRYRKKHRPNRIRLPLYCYHHNGAQKYNFPFPSQSKFNVCLFVFFNSKQPWATLVAPIVLLTSINPAAVVK